MRGLVIPVNEPGRWVEWHEDDQLLDLLYREIQTDTVEAIPVRGIGDRDVTVWVDENGWFRDTPQRNDAALALVQAAGSTAFPIVGTAVVTGGADQDGATEGLTDQHIAALPQVLSEPTGARPGTAARTRGEPP